MKTAVSRVLPFLLVTQAWLGTSISLASTLHYTSDPGRHLLLGDPNSPDYRVCRDPNGQEIKGWQADPNGVIRLRVWLDGLNADQKRIAVEALSQWGSFATADASAASTNYAGSDGPGYANKSVMNGNPLQDGTSARSLNQADIDGMNHLYSGKSFDIQVVATADAANFTVELDASATVSTGGCHWNSAGYITSGWIKLPQSLGTVPGTNPAVAREWFYTVGAGTVTNANKDAGGKLISEYAVTQGGYQYFTHMDFFSQMMHEGGHGLGFDHSVPEPASLSVLVLGVLCGLRRRRL